MAVNLSDIIRMMESIAPSYLAEEWDNVGLQIGQPDWPVEKVWLALDPLPDVVAAACEQGVNLLITHHPLFLKPLHTIDFNSPVGSIIQQAARQRLAIFSAHTNLDSVADGLNDLFAHRIGLKKIRLLGTAKTPNQFKLIVFVPPDYEQEILTALFESGAGRIGAYSCCSFRTAGKGTFKPGTGAQPFSGRTGEISDVDEIRIEALVGSHELKRTIARLREKHPYETMAYDLYPLSSGESHDGLGRIGELGEHVDLDSLAESIKKKFGVKSVKVAGRPDLPVNKIALCSGSGSGLIDAFFSSGADVYISGDLRYHDARTAESLDRGLIDIGHFATERLVVDALSDRLAKMMAHHHMDVRSNRVVWKATRFITDKSEHG